MANSDLPQERRQHLLNELRLNGKLVTAELAARYDVSEDTIRRDLRDLANAGLLKRVHGGALPVSPSNAPYEEREKQSMENKATLAQAAAQLVQDGQVILIGGGTTNAEIARHLPANLRATVITTSPHVAIHLVHHPNLEVIIIGGRLNKNEFIAASAEAVAQLRQFQADLCFLGVCSLHPEVGYTTNEYDDIAITRALIEQSGEAVATVTAAKLGTLAPFVVAPLDQITHIVTEKHVSDEDLAPYIAQGIQVTRAD